MRLRPRSLHGRLLALLGLGMALVWAAVGLELWQDTRQEFEALLDGNLAQAAALVVVQQAVEIREHGERTGDVHGLDEALLQRHARRVSLQVYHGQRPILMSARAPAEPFLPLARFAPGFHTLQVGREAWRVFAVRGGDEHDLTVYVGETIASRQDLLWAMLRSAFWPLLLALPLSWLAVVAAVRGGLAPLRRLKDLLRRREPADLSPLKLPELPPELVPTLEALNQLFERINGLLQTERRFTADAAHELRTPIAGIRAQAQVALGAADRADRRAALEATLAGCDRAARLVDQLLMLARLEAHDTPMRSRVDVAALAQRVLADAVPRALAKQQTLELEGGDTEITVRTEEILLAAVLRNLVDNAVRYSPPGALVRVRLEPLQPGRGPALVVEDSGPGLAAAEIARLGQRFLRGPNSAEAGSGLGWSILQRIAQALRLELAVDRSAALGGLWVRVQLPR